jgi:hypothetical protein
MSRAGWDIQTHYDLGGAHPLVGRSVPDHMFDDGWTILLDPTADAALAAFAGRYACRIKYVTGSVRDRLGAGAQLVRPGGIVAWACGDAPSR